MNRYEASQATRESNAPDTAIISITDFGDERNEFHSAKWLIAILELQFNDVDSKGHRCITEEDAMKIADFVLQIQEKVERIIVHCEYGQSRSAGVTAAIQQYTTGSDGGIFDDERYSPNHTCYHYVLRALNK